MCWIMSLASLRVCTSEISMIFKIESSNCTLERLCQCCKVKPRSFMIMCKVQTLVLTVRCLTYIFGELIVWSIYFSNNMEVWSCMKCIIKKSKLFDSQFVYFLFFTLVQISILSVAVEIYHEFSEIWI